MVFKYDVGWRLLDILAVVNGCDSLLILINHNCRVINATNSIMTVLQNSNDYDIVII